MPIPIQPSSDPAFRIYLSRWFSPRGLVVHLLNLYYFYIVNLIRVSLAQILSLYGVSSRRFPRLVSGGCHAVSRPILLIPQYYRTFLSASPISTLTLSWDSAAFEYSQQIGHPERHWLLRMVCRSGWAFIEFPWLWSVDPLSMIDKP
jgi:hypothetical protein